MAKFQIGDKIVNVSDPADEAGSIGPLKIGDRYTVTGTGSNDVEFFDHKNVERFRPSDRYTLAVSQPVVTVTTPTSRVLKDVMERLADLTYFDMLRLAAHVTDPDQLSQPNAIHGTAVRLANAKAALC